MKHSEPPNQTFDSGTDAPRGTYIWIWIVLIVGSAALWASRTHRQFPGDPSIDDIEIAATASRIDDITPIFDFALLADETRAVCRSMDHRIEICDIHSGKTVATLEFRGKHAIDMSVGKNGDVLLVGYRDGTLVLWSVDAKSNRYRPRILGDDSALSCCAISTDSRLVASGSIDGMVTLWDVGNGSRVHRMQAHSGHVSSVRFAPGGLKLLSTRRTLCVWDVETGELQTRLAGHDHVIGSAEFTADGRYVFSFSPYDRAPRIWDIVDKAEKPRIQLAECQTTSIAVRPDGNVVAAGDFRGDVSIWDVSNGRRISTLAVSQNSVSCVKFSADGKRIYFSGGPGGSIQVYEVATGSAAGDTQP